MTMSANIRNFIEKYKNNSLIHTNRNFSLVISEDDDEHQSALYDKVKSYFCSNETNYISRSMGETNECDLDFIFVDDYIHGHLKSTNSKVRKKMDAEYSRVLNDKPKEELDNMLDVLNRDFRQIPHLSSELEISDKIDYPQEYERMPLLETASLMCMALLFIRKITECDSPFIVQGAWFNRLDVKVRYELCRLLACHTKQTIIFTNRHIIDRPYEYGADKSLQEALRHDGVLRSVDSEKGIMKNDTD